MYLLINLRINYLQNKIQSLIFGVVILAKSNVSKQKKRPT